MRSAINDQLAESKESYSQRICGVPCRLHPRAGEFICIREFDGQAFLLRTREVQVLKRLSSFKPLAEWMTILCKENIVYKLTLLKYVPAKVKLWLGVRLENLSYHNATTVYGSVFQEYGHTIDALLAKGLLVFEKQALISVSEENRLTNDILRIETLCIPTHNRVDNLSKCINSFARAANTHGRQNLRMIVVDDSPSQSTQNANRNAVSATSRDFGVDIEHIGTAERQMLIDFLISKRVASPDVVQFAFRPNQTVTTLGSVRNVMFLLTSGKLVLHTDDDTSCAFSSVSRSDNKAKISSSWDPCDTWFYASREGNLAENPLSEAFDPFALHESVLGKPIHDVLSTHSVISLENLDVQGLHDLQSGAGRVKVTSTGASGDPGLGSSIGFLLNDSVNTLQRVYSSTESYEAAIRERQVLRVASELTIARGAYFQSMSFGIDNTSICPPFFPLGRNQDSVFHRLNLRIDSRAWACHLPHAICHESELCRAYVSPFDNPCYLQLTDIVQLCLDAAPHHKYLMPYEALKYLGQFLSELGSTSPTAFRSFVRVQFANNRASLMAAIESLPSKTSFKCEAWIRDIDRLLEGLRASIMSEGSIVPSDLAQKVGNDVAMTMTQSYVAMYGRLLIEWEDVIAAASLVQGTILSAS